MFIAPLAHVVHQFIPTEPIKKFSRVVPAIWRNIYPISLAAIALAALSSIPSARGGPITYALCTAGCALIPVPFVRLSCMTACLPLLGSPTP